MVYAYNQVTENMFGDIINNLGAITQGGLGIAAGAFLLLKPGYECSE